MDQLQIKQNLKQLGINEQEGNIYLTVLINGPLATTNISRMTKIPKTNVYRHIDSMLAKNLIEKIIGPRGVLIKATDPENLKLILDEKEEHVNRLKNTFSSLLFDLESLAKNPKHKTQVKYYEDAKGIKQLLWNTLEAKEVVGYGYTNWNKYVGEKFAEKLRQEYLFRKIKSKEILNSIGEFTNNRSYLEKVWEGRIIDKTKLEINYNTIIYNDVFASYSYYSNEIFGIEIINREMAETQRQIFEILWRIAEKHK